MSVAPIPVCPLLPTVRPGEGNIIPVVFSPESLVGVNFAVIPVVVVTVVAIVDSYTDALRRGVGLNRRRSNKRGG